MEHARLPADPEIKVNPVIHLYVCDLCDFSVKETVWQPQEKKGA